MQENAPGWALKNTLKSGLMLVMYNSVRSAQLLLVGTNRVE